MWSPNRVFTRVINPTRHSYICIGPPRCHIGPTPPVKTEMQLGPINLAKQGREADSISFDFIHSPIWAHSSVKYRAMLMCRGRSIPGSAPTDRGILDIGNPNRGPLEIERESESCHGSIENIDTYK